MKNKTDWFSNCAFLMPVFGFAVSLFIEFIVIGCEEERRPDTGFLVMVISIFIGIMMALICFFADNNRKLRIKTLFAITWNVLIFLQVVMVSQWLSLEPIREHRITMLQKRLARMPPPDDGRTPKKGDYMLIDLSGGTGASNYPITRMTAMPLGGWTDEYKTTKLVLRKIPKGTFMMGNRSTDYPEDFMEDKNLFLNSVTLTKDFYIGVFEVTQRQWELVMGNRPSYFTNVSCYASRPVERVSYYEIRENPLPVIDVDDPEDPGRQVAGRDDPAVDWPSNNLVNASSFMGKLRAKTRLATLDLPAEAQWEYACRAGTTTALNTGYNLNGGIISGIDPHMDVTGRYRANGIDLYGDKRSVKTLGGTAKVGSYLPNVWGLYDMHGNVQEWCLDWDYPLLESVTDTGGAVSVYARVTRGGHWATPAYFYNSEKRFETNPARRSDVIGFRIACTQP
jgi:formylglycine-generating enzyme required for sulfatase activity